MEDVRAVRKGDRNTQQTASQPMRYVRAPFWSKVGTGDSDACWPWLAGRVGSGYGTCGPGIYAHRVAYEISVGPIPDGLTIDHLCSNRICCNPSHLEPVTREENARRGEKNRRTRSGGRSLASRTECKNGHAYVEGSFRWSGTARVCRQCARDRRRTFRERTGR
ncbi:HNH endonuclease [Pseudonocardia sediminis]|uniref:HNH endonuclease n=1 Tax=Pseudonocardia sediminis TaxID=1397368 RepID=A0A4Q7V499_PSEST|nr:HNH endonuclease [Pseudonocardia sediminis]